MWEWMRNAGRAEKEKLQRTSAAADRGRRDDEAMARLDVGQEVDTPDGWTGFVAEKYPRSGKVYVESWERGGTYHASEVTPAGGTSLTGEL